MSPPLHTTQTTDWKGIGIIFFSGIAAALALSKASPAALDLQRSLQLTLSQIGWVMSAGAIASFVLGILSGSLMSWFGASRLLRSGLVALVVAGLLSTFAPTAAWLLFGRAIEGIGIVFIAVSSPTLVARLTRWQDLGLAMGVWALWMPAGSLIMLLLAPAALAVFHWRGLWVVSAIAAFFALLLALRLPQFPASTAKPQVQWNLFVQRGPLLLAAAFFCFTSQFFSVFTFLPTHLQQTFDLNPAEASLLTALVPACILPGNLFGGWLVHRGWAPSTLLWLPACGLLGIIPLFFMWPHHPPFTYLILIVYGFVLGLIPTGIFSQIPRLATRPEMTGTIVGLAHSGQGLGVLVGPPLVGSILERTGSWSEAVWVLLLMIAILIVAGRLLGKR